MPGYSHDSPPRSLIIVADDDDDSRTLIAGFLRRAGFSVIETHDGTELCEVVEQEARSELRPRAVVSDVGMPGCDGLAATRRLHELMPGLPVLLVTGYRDPETWRAARAAGAAFVLAKPVHSEVLLDAVHDAVDQAVSLQGA